VAVLQNELELAVRNGLKLKDTVNINDGGSMNADESHGIEMAERCRSYDRAESRRSHSAFY